MIKGIVFDLDGVLVSTDELHYRAWKALAGRLGIPFDRAQNDRCRGISRMESLEIVLERSPKSFSPEEKAALAAEKNNNYRAMLAVLTPSDALEGAAETLAALRARGYRLALASSSKNAPLILERTGLGAYLDAVVDGSRVTRSKPDPEIFLTAARELGLEPGECAGVDDALAGVESARAAGLLAVGIGPSAAAGAGDYNISRLGELLPLFPGAEGGIR